MSDDFTKATVEIFEWAREILGRKEVGTANRCSSADACVRQRWMQNHGIQGEPMLPRSLLVFATGDMVEHVMKYLIAQANVGPNKLYSEVDFGKKDGTFTIQHREFDIYKQEDLTFTINSELTISGHADGWGRRNSDGQWELIEIKSSSFQGYLKFLKGETNYRKQLQALMMTNKAQALKVKSVRLFYMNKNTSDIFERSYEFDGLMGDEIKIEYLLTNKDEMPDIPDAPDIGPEIDKKTGKTKLGWRCSYCDYKKNCFPTMIIEYSSAGKPMMVLPPAKVIDLGKKKNAMANKNWDFPTKKE